MVCSNTQGRRAAGSAVAACPSLALLIWLTVYVGINSVLPVAAAKQAVEGTSISSISLSSDIHGRFNEMQKRRYEMYSYHGIIPSEREDAAEETNTEDRNQDTRNNENENEKESTVSFKIRGRKHQRIMTATEQFLQTANREATETSGGENNYYLRDAILNVRMYQQDLQLPGKKGIGFAMRDEGLDGSWVENMPLVIYLRPHWNYSWGPDLPPAQPDDIEWIPMIYTGWDEDDTKSVLEQQIVPLYEAGVIKRMMGFNEPDRSSQADMTVEKAAMFWPIIESTGIPLASPAVAYDGMDWMSDWMATVKENNFRQDYIAVHWYGWPSVEDFKDSMKSMYELHGGITPILLTEFAPADWAATSVEDNRFTRNQVLQFMKVVLPWMEEQDWIAGYAWFPFTSSWPEGVCSCLFEEDGTPTALGRYYASVRSDNPEGDQSIQVE